MFKDRGEFEKNPKPTATLITYLVHNKLKKNNSHSIKRHKMAFLRVRDSFGKFSYLMVGCVRSLFIGLRRNFIPPLFHTK